MTAPEVLQALREQGIVAAIADGELVLRGKTRRLTPEMLAEVRTRKAELLALLRDTPSAEAPCADQTEEQRRQREAEQLLSPYSRLIEAARRGQLRGNVRLENGWQYVAGYYVCTVANALADNLDSPLRASWLENLRRLSEWWDRAEEGQVLLAPFAGLIDAARRGRVPSLPVVYPDGEVAEFRIAVLDTEATVWDGVLRGDAEARKSLPVFLNSLRILQELWERARAGGT